MKYTFSLIIVFLLWKLYFLQACVVHWCECEPVPVSACISLPFAIVRICGNKSVSFNLTKLMICDLSKVDTLLNILN